MADETPPVDAGENREAPIGNTAALQPDFNEFLNLFTQVLKNITPKVNHLPNTLELIPVFSGCGTPTVTFWQHCKMLQQTLGPLERKCYRLLRCACVERRFDA